MIDISIVVQLGLSGFLTSKDSLKGRQSMYIHRYVVLDSLVYPKINMLSLVQAVEQEGL